MKIPAYKLIAVAAICQLCLLSGQLYGQPDTMRQGLINIGYHSLFVQLFAAPASKYTIVFESGGGGSSKDWDKVKSFLPAGMQTLCYDRASTGKSEMGPLPRTMAQEVFELHHLLQVLQIKGPLILVGQSLGGLNVRLYAEKYSKDIAGLVLVDPTNESGMLGSMRYGGWVRLREKAVGKPIPAPQLKTKFSDKYDSTADYMAEEFKQIYLHRNGHPRPFKNRPLLVLGAGVNQQPPGTPDEQWKQIVSEKEEQIGALTSLSGNGLFIRVAKSGHAIQQESPETVAKAIEMVIRSSQSKTKLPVPEHL